MAESVNRAAEAGRRAFYDRAASQRLAPLWRVIGGLVAERPHSPCRAALWRYEEVRPFLLESCNIISTDEAERRVLVLENPGMPGESRITRNLFCGLQIILPGEIAPAHRHVATALRFIMEGHDAYTAVAGERTTMEPGDFVITPSWAWHDHGNESDEPMIWVDGLDMHIVNMCDASFRESYPGHTHPIVRPEGSAHAEAGANLVPVDFNSRSLSSPIFNYPYRATREALDGLRRFRDPDPCHGYKMRYTNPLNGGSAIPTITATMQLLPAGFKAEPYRCTGGSVYIVVEGAGNAAIGTQTFFWEPRDIFVVPSWEPLELQAATEAVIFCYSDRVVQEKLGFFREQRGGD